MSTFQSTHPVRGATQILRIFVGRQTISIHAPREGCDNLPKTCNEWFLISIHAPREGCDSGSPHIVTPVAFQSTHPVRGATRPQRTAPHRRPFQSTHPVRGATVKIVLETLNQLFQSTHPVRGATVFHVECFVALVISIHAPREGCDSQAQS